MTRRHPSKYGRHWAIADRSSSSRCRNAPQCLRRSQHRDHSLLPDPGTHAGSPVWPYVHAAGQEVGRYPARYSPLASSSSVTTNFGSLVIISCIIFLSLRIVSLGGRFHELFSVALRG